MAKWLHLILNLLRLILIYFCNTAWSFWYYENVFINFTIFFLEYIARIIQYDVENPTEQYYYEYDILFTLYY